LNQKFQRILIVRTDRIGDVILTLPMAEVLKRKIPDVQIAMLVRRYTSEIIEGNSNIHHIVYYDEHDQPVPFFHLVDTMRKEKFDVVFHTHPLFRVALMTWLARIPVRVGTGYRWYSFLFNRKVFEHRKDAKRHELEYNLNLLDAIGCSPNNESITPTLAVQQSALKKVRSMLANAGVENGAKLVIIHPGSGGSARDWKWENFGVLGQCLSLLPNVRVILTGSDVEKEIIERVKSLIGKTAIVFVGTLSIKELAALAKLASLFVANSTGPLHIAAAVGTPVIGLYPQITALSAERWGPYTTKKTIFTPKDKPSDCNKCVTKKSSSCECMNSISVEEVYSAAKKYLVNE
jgi:heptosyltransferase-3